MEIQKLTLTMGKVSLMLTVLLLSLSLRAGVIDFETTASGLTPADDQVIKLSDIFMIDSVGVSFGFDSNNNGELNAKAVFEQAGNVDIKPKRTGFWGRMAKILQRQA